MRSCPYVCVCAAVETFAGPLEDRSAGPRRLVPLLLPPQELEPRPRFVVLSLQRGQVALQAFDAGPLAVGTFVQYSLHCFTELIYLARVRQIPPTNRHKPINSTSLPSHFPLAIFDLDAKTPVCFFQHLNARVAFSQRFFLKILYLFQALHGENRE